MLTNHVRIERILFVGTPHLGAPMAFKSLADEYLLSSSKSGRLEKIVGRKFARPLNTYGATFDSIYELLPIATSGCFKPNEIPKGKEAAEFVFGSQTTVPIKIFNPELWKKNKWPKQAYTNQRLDLVGDLNERLRLAHQHMCNLARQDYTAHRVLKVYSKSEPGTPCAVLYRSPERHDEIAAILPVQGCGGDGTVPEYFATDAGRGFHREIDGEHMGLIAAEGFIQILKEIHTELENKVNLDFAAIGGSRTLPPMLSSARWCTTPAQEL